MNNFRMAYLILAHKNAQQVNLLINQLKHQQVDIYIHVDKKSEIYREIQTGDNVYFTDQRIKVEWGTVSQVYAIVELLKCVRKKRYNYIHLISGQDLPLYSQDYIIDFFEKNEGKQFLSLWKAEGFWLSRVAVYYPQFLLSNNQMFKIIRGIYARFIMLTKIFKRSYTMLDEIYVGSNWFSITGGCAEYLLDHIEENLFLLNFYKSTLCPDELVFNTLIYNSSFKDSIVNDNLRYIDWNNQKDSPKILLSDDYEKIITSRKLFGRKFDEYLDTEIIQKILDRY